MSRITQQLNQKRAYVAYLTAGDGGIQHSLHSILALITGGVDIIEIGIPFSDPVADGLVIQQASFRALQAGTTIKNIFNLVSELRKRTQIPIVLFSYYNPIFKYGPTFYQDAEQAGVDGCLMVDLPLEESAEHLKLCKKHQIDPIFLISPSTSEARIKIISEHGRGMLYYVCRNGTTGVKSSLPENFAENMRRIKQNTNLPIVTGFGISNKEMAGQAIKYADGFVVGSLFVETTARIKDYAELTRLAKSLDPRS